MSRIFRELAGAVKGQSNKYSMALETYLDHSTGTSDETEYEAEKVIVLKSSHVAVAFIGLTLLTLLALGTGLRALADSQQSSVSGERFKAVLSSYDKKISALEETMAGRRAESAREFSVIKKDLRLAQSQLGDLHKEVSDAVLEGDIMKMKIQDLGSSQEQMVNKLVELSNNLSVGKDVTQETAE